MESQNVTVQPDTIILPKVVFEGKYDKTTFLEALKFIRNMNMVPKCVFSEKSSSPDFKLYSVEHITPPLLKAFVKKDKTNYTEIINSKPEGVIVISCIPIDAGATPYMKTNTVFKFKGNSLEVECIISAKLFKKKAMPSVARGIFTTFAKNKSNTQRKMELAVYRELRGSVLS